MKLSNRFAKLTSLKSNVVRTLAAATLAGAVLLAATPAAEAQHFAIGVRIGAPYHYVPAPPPSRFYGYGYGYDRFHHDDWRFRHEYYRYDRFGHRY